MGTQNSVMCRGMPGWLMLAILLGLYDLSFLAAEESTTPQTTKSSFQLRSLVQPLPFNILGEPRGGFATSVEIQGDLGKGRGTLALDESIHRFNDFGDATVVDRKKPNLIPIILKPLPVKDDQDGSKIFEIVMEKRLSSRRLHLVIFGEKVGSHRLLIFPHAAIDDSFGTGLVYSSELTGFPQVAPAVPDSPIRPRINLTAMSRMNRRMPGPPCPVTIQGTLGGPGELALDPNIIAFNEVGHAVSKTMMGYSPSQVDLKQVDAVDPANQGRRLFEIMPKKGELRYSYHVVLASTEGGPHRLLIREQGKLAEVLSLHDPDRLRHMTISESLEQAARDERQAIGDLQKAIGFRFQFKVQSDQVTDLIAEGEDANQLEIALPRLTYLRRLSLSNARFDKAIGNLKNSTNLEQLTIENSQISDQAFESISGLHNLQMLRLKNCFGFTDEAFAHAVGLKSLKHLEIRRDNFDSQMNRREPSVADDCLKYLSQLSNLEYLDLTGQIVTDAGLTQLQPLTKLKRLLLWSANITDAGMPHLAPLKNLRYLQLQSTSVTADGKAALRSQLPSIRFAYP